MFSLSENIQLASYYNGKRVFDFACGNHKGRLFFHKDDYGGGAATDLKTVYDNVHMALGNIERTMNDPPVAGQNLLAKTTLFSQQLAHQLATVAGLRFDAYTPLYH